MPETYPPQMAYNGVVLFVHIGGGKYRRVRDGVIVTYQQAGAEQFEMWRRDPASAAPGRAPAPAPQAAAAPQAAPPGGTYTVRAGDTLSSIAARHRTTVAALASLNGIKNINLVFVGQRLRIPGGAQAGAQQTQGAPPQPTQQQPGIDAAARAAAEEQERKKKAAQTQQLLLIGGAALVLVLLVSR